MGGRQWQQRQKGFQPPNRQLIGFGNDNNGGFGPTRQQSGLGFGQRQSSKRSSNGSRSRTCTFVLEKQGGMRAGNECIAVREGFKRVSVSQGNYRYLYCSKGGGICVGNGGVIEDEAKLSRAQSRAHELEFQQLANTTCVITHTMWMWYWPTIVNLV